MILQIAPTQCTRMSSSCDAAQRFYPSPGGYQGNRLTSRNEQRTFYKKWREQINTQDNNDGFGRKFSCLITCLWQGYNIISVLSLEIVPIMELLASMKTHSVPEDVDVSSAQTHTLVLTCNVFQTETVHCIGGALYKRSCLVAPHSMIQQICCPQTCQMPQKRVAQEGSGSVSPMTHLLLPFHCF